MAPRTRMDWAAMDYRTRVEINGPTTAIYSTANLPQASDPGWAQWKGVNGQSVRLIEVHGPFAVRGFHGPEERCEDGWLGVDENGKVFAVDSEYENEAAWPVGYAREDG